MVILLLWQPLMKLIYGPAEIPEQTTDTTSVVEEMADTPETVFVEQPPPATTTQSIEPIDSVQMAEALAEPEKEITVKMGNIIVATGLKTFDPSVIDEYGYGKLPNVVTSMEFEKMLIDGKIQTKDGYEPKNVAIIHCVGSRNEKYHPYCSRTCCMTAIKFQPDPPHCV